MHTFRYYLYLFIISLLSCPHFVIAESDPLNKAIGTLENCEEEIAKDVIKSTLNPSLSNNTENNFYTSVWNVTKSIGSNLWIIASHPLIALAVAYFLKEYLFNLQKKERQEVDFVMNISTKMLNNEKDLIDIRHNYDDLVQNCADKYEHTTDPDTKKNWQQLKEEYKKEYKLTNEVALKTKQNALSLQNNFAKDLLKKEIGELKKMLQETKDLQQKECIQKLIVQKEDTLIGLYND